MSRLPQPGRTAGSTSEMNLEREQMQEEPRKLQYEIVFNPEASRTAVRFVTSGSLSLRELPAELWRMVYTRDFFVYCGVPVILLILGKAAASVSASMQHVEIALTVVAVIWLLAGLVFIYRFGRTFAVACFFADEGTGGKRIAGGLRVRADRRNRKIRIAGVLVDENHRNRGIFSALLLALFRLAADRPSKEAGLAPVHIMIFAAAHEASIAVDRRYFGGSGDIAVDNDPNSRFMKSMGLLENEISLLREKGVEFTFVLDRPEADGILGMP